MWSRGKIWVWYLFLDNSKQFAVTSFYKRKKKSETEISSCYFLHIFHGAQKSKLHLQYLDIDVSQRVDGSINNGNN